MKAGLELAFPLSIGALDALGRTFPSVARGKTMRAAEVDGS